MLRLPGDDETASRVSAYINSSQSVANGARAPPRGSTRGSVYEPVSFTRWLPGEAEFNTIQDRAGINLSNYERLARNQLQKQLDNLSEYIRYVNELMQSNATQVLATANFKDMLKTPILPEHANNFIEKSVFMSFYPSPEGILHAQNIKADTFKPLYICPDTARDFFRSKDKYMQGKVPYSPEPQGNLSNTYVCELKLRHYGNPFPFPVGVTILHDGRPIGEAREFYAGQSGTGTQFHAILNPLTTVSYKSDGPQLYKTNEEVNAEYAQQFPNLIADKTYIKRHVYKEDGGFVRVPVIHPITYWIYRECAYFKGMDPPTPIELVNDPTVRNVKIKARTCEFAADSLVTMVSDRIPIIDLCKLAVKLTPLDWQLYRTDTEALCHKIIPGKALGTNILDPKGITLSLSMLYMFKDHYNSENVDGMDAGHFEDIDEHEVD